MKLRFASFIVFAIFLISLAGAATFGTTTSSASFANSQQQATFQTYYTQDNLNTYWPILGNKETCQGRQDFLLQVAPGGCQPAVVRSDLLAEQNVPVFCQINALQVNPLLDIREISNIRFTGNYPKEVVGAGFHPARAALTTRDTLLGSPLVNNIGYVVLVLKQNPVEKTLPDFVNVTLSGQVEYTAGNALGIGTSEFVLTPVSDADWATARNSQSFWKGRYYVRLDDADSNYATVSLYNGDTRISTTRVQTGKTSEPIYMPGYYCQAGVKINNNGFVDAKTNARIRVGDNGAYDTLDVYEGTKFLNDKCTVTRITKDPTSETGRVSVSCSGTQSFDLLIQPYFSSAYDIILNNNKKLDIKYNDDVKREYYQANTANGVYALKLTNGKIADDSLYNYNTGTSNFELLSGSLTENQTKIKEALTLYYTVYVLKDQKKAATITANMFKDVLLANSENSIEELKFQDAINKLEAVANDYPSEKSKDTTVQTTYAEDALWKAYELTKDTAGKKKATAARVLGKLVDNYPDSINAALYKSELDKVYQTDSSFSGRSLIIDGKVRTIELVSIKEPTTRSTAEFSMLGSSGSYAGKEGENVSGLSSSVLNSVFIEKVINENSVQIKTYCNVAPAGSTKTTVQAQSSKVLTIGGNMEEVCTNVRIRLESVNLQKAVKIRLLPEVQGTKTQTNLSVTIGIEKRNIQLSPDKVNETIKNLNESIKKWESISKKLANVVKGMKAACFATSAVLTVKNFVTGFSGSSVARQQTMQGDYGWTAKCKKAIDSGTIDGKQVAYRTLTQCYNDNKDAIESEVSARTKVIQDVNTKLQNIEQPHTTQASGLEAFTSGSNVDTMASRNDLLKELKTNYGSSTFIQQRTVATKETTTAGSYQDLRDWLAAKELEDAGVASGTQQRLAIEKKVTADQALIDKYNAETGAGGLQSYVTNEKARVLSTSKLYDVTTDGGTKVGGLSTTGATLSQGQSAALVTAKADNGKSTEAKQYLIVGTKGANNVLNPEKIYEYNFDKNTKAVTLTETNLDKTNFYNVNNIAAIQDSGCGSLKGNQIVATDMQVRYFETGPDKGMPAQLPFDSKNGWYAKVTSSLSIGNTIAAYDASGLPKSWWICNVGSNGQIDSGDECQQIINGVNSGASVLCLGAEESKLRITQSQQALMQAAQQRSSGRVKLNLPGGVSEDLKMGTPMTTFDGVQCQDFMSATDCQILFNVCDPVICPPTRCNLGGQYPVSDVIQTGIVGSIVLCLPNIREGIFIPVCLTGIQAGIDSYVSILKNHRDCLQESLKSGKMIGICDEIYSIYLCEFFWRQLAPVANILLPKIIEFAYGQQQGARGGGEYATVMGAWQNTQKSIDYFTQVYAVNSMQAFNIRSVEEAGTQFCKGFISAKGPSSLETLIEPDSPSQFQAYFDAIPYTTATVPATSQYKVFYHIFAGNDQGVYYSVYLKDPPDSVYYRNTPYIQVANGFITKGQYASETKDFTAPEGYKQLCVSINNKEWCGFGKVTTDFAVNYLSDQYAKDELTNANIQSESQCISGSSGNLGNMITPNLQSGVSNTLMPQVSNQGIVRICATQNPGSSTEPLRYQDVGFCGDKTVRCWLDTKSVNNAITSSDLLTKDQTLASLQQSAIQNLQAQGQILDENQVNAYLNAQNGYTFNVSSFEDEYINKKDKSTLVEADKANAVSQRDSIIKNFDDAFGTILEKILYNHQKAQVSLLKARTDTVVAQVYARMIKSDAPVATSSGTTSASDTGSSNADTGSTSNMGSTYAPNFYILSPDSVNNRANLLFEGSPTGIYIKDKKIYYSTSVSLSHTPVNESVGTVGDDDKINILSGILTQGISYFQDKQLSITQAVIDHLTEINGKTFSVLAIGYTKATATGSSSTNAQVDIRDNFDASGRQYITINGASSSVYIGDNNKIYALLTSKNDIRADVPIGNLSVNTGISGHMSGFASIDPDILANGAGSSILKDYFVSDQDVAIMKAINGKSLQEISNGITLSSNTGTAGNGGGTTLTATGDGVEKNYGSKVKNLEFVLNNGDVSSDIHYRYLGNNIWEYEDSQPAFYSVWAPVSGYQKDTGLWGLRDQDRAVVKSLVGKGLSDGIIALLKSARDYPKCSICSTPSLDAGKTEFDQEVLKKTYSDKYLDENKVKIIAQILAANIDAIN